MTRSVMGLAALLAFTGVMHFVAPRTFEKIVPPTLGNARFFVLASGTGELAASAALLHPRARRVGALWCIALFIGVFPANIYMAIDQNATTVPQWISWARLPLQPLLIWWAYRIYVRSLPAGNASSTKER